MMLYLFKHSVKDLIRFSFYVLTFSVLTTFKPKINLHVDDDECVGFNMSIVSAF